ncbi:hypothetical protein KRX11_10125 [Pasteurellaceae bacterium TAE3-ERU1]|nr:hypothetical protein [Pasteurellaceae bacterium TAE3-ERU1]
MWEGLFSSIIKELKDNLDTLLGGIMCWFSAFIALWYLMPYKTKFLLMHTVLPGLPQYTFFYIVYILTTTAIWYLSLSLLNGIANWRWRIERVEQQKSTDNKDGVDNDEN